MTSLCCFTRACEEYFPIVHEAVGTLIDRQSSAGSGSAISNRTNAARSTSGKLAPDATAVCSLVGKMVSVDDFAPKNPAKGMMDGETFSTGSKSFRFIATPHVPHCWEAGMLLEETTGTLFCTDLFHQNGDVEAKTNNSVVDRARETFVEYQQGPLANYFPYTANTDNEIKRLAALKPRILATMHGSVYEGDGEKALIEYADMVNEILRAEISQQ